MMAEGTRDRLMTQLQDAGLLRIPNSYDFTLAEVASMVIDLGIDPKRVLIKADFCDVTLMVMEAEVE